MLSSLYARRALNSAVHLSLWRSAAGTRTHCLAPRGFLHARWHCELNRDVVLDGIPPYMGIKSTAGELYMRVQIDENSVTLTPFGSLIRINPANATDEHKSWLEILRTALSHHREKRSDEMPVAD